METLKRSRPQVSSTVSASYSGTRARRAYFNGATSLRFFTPSITVVTILQLDCRVNNAGLIATYEPTFHLDSSPPSHFSPIDVASSTVFPPINEHRYRIKSGNTVVPSSHRFPPFPVTCQGDMEHKSSSTTRNKIFPVAEYSRLNYSDLWTPRMNIFGKKKRAIWSRNRRVLDTLHAVDISAARSTHKAGHSFDIKAIPP